MRRVYFFEVFAVANLLAIVALAHDTTSFVGSPLRSITGFLTVFLVQAILGIVVRSLVAAFRRDRAWFRRIRTLEWISDTIRLIVFGAVMVTTYAWIKVVVPLEHPRLFDQELWDLDRALFLGVAPVLFLLDLFDSRPFLQAIDWSYANIFFASTFVAFAWFFSDPSRRVRIAFANGNAVLWICGAWLYMLVPSLGPAYRFPDIWLAHAESLQITQKLQAVLMRNYQNVLRAAAGDPVTTPIRVAFGIGAFPSLHVAFQLYVFYWMRRLWTSGEVLFGIFAVTIFIGSMLTGWHYLIDGIAGALLAWASYRIFWQRARMTRWTELRSSLPNQSRRAAPIATT